MISRWLSETSDSAIQVKEAPSTPPYCMERERWIGAEWGFSETGRRSRFYKLTPKSGKQLAGEARRFAEFVQTVTPILLPEG